VFSNKLGGEINGANGDKKESDEDNFPAVIFGDTQYGEIGLKRGLLSMGEAESR